MKEHVSFCEPAVDGYFFKLAKLAFREPLEKRDGGNLVESSQVVSSASVMSETPESETDTGESLQARGMESAGLPGR
jgi:hypothetical protein